MAQPDLFSKLVDTEMWDRFDVAIEKPYIYAEATQLAMVFVKKYQAYLTHAFFPHYYIIGDEISLGPAIDVKCCYDARWRTDDNGTHSLFTIGTPYIALVDTSNRLFVFQNGGPRVHLASGVSRCAIVRGWKHASDYVKDQGIVVWYIRQGRLYSRSYIQIGPSSYTWSAEEAHNGLQVIDITVKRTADFRLAVMCTTSNGNQLLLTERTWPGQSVRDEYVYVKEQHTAKITLTQIKDHPVRKTFEYVYDIETHKNKNIVCQNNLILGMMAYNILGNVVYVQISDTPTQNNLSTNLASFRISDESGFVYPVINALLEEYWIKLEVLDLNNSLGQIKVEILPGLITAHNQPILARDCVFMPTGLIPVPPDPPTQVSIKNVNTEVI